MMKPSVGVVIPFRNRDPRSVQRLLQTLVGQSVCPDAVAVVNFGEACNGLEFPNAPFRYVLRHLPQPKIWCRSLASNQAAHLLGNVDTLLFTDCDVLFARDFLEKGFECFEDFPRSILNCRILDLPKDAFDTGLDVVKDYEKLKAMATGPRESRESGACQWLFRTDFEAMRGHCEEYKLWTREDGDFHRRALWMGITAVQLYPTTSFLHQWHPTKREIAKESSEMGEACRQWAEWNLHRLDERYRLWKEGKFQPDTVNPQGWGRIDPNHFC